MKKDPRTNLNTSIIPKKSLGQNFLTSVAAVAHIVEAADIQKNEIVLEIGPGKGVLTEKLLEAGAEVRAIEKDRRLIPILKEKFIKEMHDGRLKIIEGDVLEIPHTQIIDHKTSFKLIANIPYYITGMILRKFLTRELHPTQAVILIQKEVAQRIIARDKKESILSLSVKAYGIPRIVSIVKAGSFFPKPQVDSAILSINSISGDFFSHFSEKSFFTLIHAGFAQKRKLLKRNLESVYKKEAIEISFAQNSIPLNARAEDLTLQTWKYLCKSLTH
jgi:16S rRNA (adenine1518-N6/adenine1519-N6)-dimethyltransferase